MMPRTTSSVLGSAGTAPSANAPKNTEVTVADPMLAASCCTALDDPPATPFLDALITGIATTARADAV